MASDGKMKIKAMLPTNLSSEVNSGKLQNLGLIRILDYTCNTIPNQTDKAFIVTKCEVVSPALDYEIKDEAEETATLLKSKEDSVQCTQTVRRNVIEPNLKGLEEVVQKLEPGTLTENKMEFQCASISGIDYSNGKASVPDDRGVYSVIVGDQYWRPKTAVKIASIARSFEDEYHKELDVSTILTILQCCGMKLRGDDPISIKCFVVTIQNRVNELKSDKSIKEGRYPILHALLEYIYSSQTKVVESQFDSLRDLSVQFQVLSLIKRCNEISDCFKTARKLFDSGMKVEIFSSTCEVQQSGLFPLEEPAVVGNLKQFLANGEHSDVNIYVEGHGLVARSHKLILSMWSTPYAKMFTGGMVESKSADVTFRDVSSEAFLAMLHFMYNGELEIENDKMDYLLIPLRLLADQFEITFLQQECCKCLLECISEDTVCPILVAIASLPSCKVVEETCKRKISMHFDYCITASTDFVQLDELVINEGSNFCEIMSSKSNEVDDSKGVERIGDLSSFDDNEHKVHHLDWGKPLHVVIPNSAFKVFDRGICLPLYLHSNNMPRRSRAF
ncbi:BTB/POZ domain-containing protein [Dendrobium catenatum]|uniref:BTB/POZ domain-containing protein n=1 Tax=Dendrobium catenatum TaxID=906689 RepID=A0A2I0V8C5_9ASPA|nr:BTB/POZ domain-containing protein [Dendrobium catenatum]